MSAIAKIYLRWVLSGEKTIYDVPEKWRAEVQVAIAQSTKD